MRISGERTSLSRTGESCTLSRTGESCRCANAPLRIFTVADFRTRKKPWEMRETPFGETCFRAVGPWLAAQVSQTIVPQVSFWCFRSKRACFTRFFVSHFYGVFTPKTGFSSEKRPLCLPYGRGQSLPYGRDFGAGDTTLGRPRRNPSLASPQGSAEQRSRFQPTRTKNHVFFIGHWLDVGTHTHRCTNSDLFVSGCRRILC